jgi:hypothetical protein
MIATGNGQQIFYNFPDFILIILENAVRRPAQGFFHTKTGGIFMATTVQHRSCAVLDDTQKSITKAEDEIEDNNRLLLSTLDSLYKLGEKVSKLDYLIQRKAIEQFFYPKGKEKQNED